MSMPTNNLYIVKQYKEFQWVRDNMDILEMLKKQQEYAEIYRRQERERKIKYMEKYRKPKK